MLGLFDGRGGVAEQVDDNLREEPVIAQDVAAAPEVQLELGHVPNAVLEQSHRASDGEVDINDHLDLSKAFRPGQEQKRVNVDFPVWMIERLDREANRIGVPRQSLIKVWIGEHLDAPKSKRILKANQAG